VITVDQLCAERNLAGPYLLKVDVQGAELQVLAGARRTLEQTEAVLLELSFFGFYLGSPQFCDVIAEMKERGFVAYDVYGFLYRPLDNALSQMDVAFVREDGLFRKSHAYATAEQRHAITAQSYEPSLAASGKKQR
jgi:hypothetical protein